MSTLTEVKKIIDSLSLNDFPVFTNNYPPEFQQDDNHSSILITNISMNYADYGSNHAEAREELIQIQFFPKQNYEYSLEDLADKVNRELESHGFYCTSSSGQLLSSGSTNVFMTMKFTHNKNLGGI